MRLLIFYFILLNIVGWGTFSYSPVAMAKTFYSQSHLTTTTPKVTPPVILPVAQIKKPQDSQMIKFTAYSRPIETAEGRWLNTEINAIKPLASNLNINVLKLSLTAYQHAQKYGVTSNPLLTIIDYSKPSTEKRLWVVDVSKQKILFNTLVAHGKNSGIVNAFSFSNYPSSLKSSIGVFVTTDIYSGKHGSSLHVRGLESGFNDNAYSRHIVFHGANYVSPYIASSGRLGRSWGCMAVSQDIIKPLINAIKNKSLVVAYYPDLKWLSKSSFLT